MTSAKIRQDRRDIEEQAQRAIKIKLLDQGYDKAMVDSLRNKAGRSITDEVEMELSLKGDQRKSSFGAEYTMNSIYLRLY